MSKLILVRGLPGSGKSTYAKTLGMIHFEADMYFERNGEYEYNPRELSKAHSWCQYKVKEYLDSGMNVVVSNTFTQLWEMDPYLEMGHDVEVIEMTEMYGSIHNIPDDKLEAMRARWEEYMPIDSPIIDEIDANEIVDRKELAVIAPILDLVGIPGKDRIEFCKVLGYTGVVECGKHEVGDLVLVVRYDSVVPEVPMFEWMRPFKFRVKTKKFNTLEGPVYSQVIIIPNSVLKECPGCVLNEGDDWTDLIGVKKWIPKSAGSGGSTFGQMKSKGDFPSHIVSKTDEMNIQSKPILLEELNGMPYRITLKCDGSSMTCLIHPDTGLFTVCSRNNMLQEVEGNKFWEAAREYNIEECLLENPEIAIQMELVGPGIQSNKMRLRNTEIRVFNIIHMGDRQRVPDDNAITFCNRYKLPMAPELGRGDSFDYTLEELLGIASRLYPGTTEQAEGIVVRPRSPVFSHTLKEGLSFKVINQEF